jgi:DNA modification methylase
MTALNQTLDLPQDAAGQSLAASPCSLFLGDCLEVMATLPDKSVDAIITDLPYGTTACKWDAVIPFAPMWEQVRRVLKPNGVFVTTASQPFTSLLVASNLDAFKYEVIWEKDKPSDFALAARRTMKYHESVLVFCDGRETYNPQMTIGVPNHSVGRGIRKKANESGANTVTVTNKLDGWKHPKSVMRFNREPAPTHPTQKPESLMRYLVRTYTNPGDVVLDPCMGSGTTRIAAKLEERSFIGIEKDAEYFRVASERISQANKEIAGA